MSVRVLSWVFESAPCTGNDRLVLLAIADEADDDGGSAFPSIGRLADKARLPRRTVMRCLDRLEAAGALEIQRPERPGRGHFNRYRVRLDPVDNPSGKGDTLTNNGANLAPIEPVKGAERRAAVPNRLQTHRPVKTTTRFAPQIDPTEATRRAQIARADEHDRRAQAEATAEAAADPATVADALAAARASIGR